MDDYYDSVDTSSAATLRSSLHEALDDHVRFPYSSSEVDTWDVLEIADEDPADSGSILDVYRNASYAKEGGGNSNYNREHTWPRSYGFPDDGPGNYPYTDCHQLFLSDIDYNSDRSNLAFGTCNAGCSEGPTLANGGQGGGSGSYPGNSNWFTGSGGTGIWETWNARKGELARAQLYLDLRYEGGLHGITGSAEPDLILTDDTSLIQTTGGVNAATAFMGRLATLLAWHAADPVTDGERLRNEVVYRFQGNRNPFVDHPEWVACLFSGAICNGGGIFANGFESGGTSAWTLTVGAP
ncbi:MAG: endonuclease [Deltaproteobacteria bacterium]|nr:endonuclease [Deltaproteobacteria bacterium]